MATVLLSSAAIWQQSYCLLLLVVKGSRAVVWLLRALEKWPAPSLSGIVLSLGAAKDFTALRGRWPGLSAAWGVVAMPGTPIPAIFPGVAKLSSWQLGVRTSQAGLWGAVSVVSAGSDQSWSNWLGLLLVLALLCGSWCTAPHRKAKIVSRVKQYIKLRELKWNLAKQ